MSQPNMTYIEMLARLSKPSQIDENSQNSGNSSTPVPLFREPPEGSPFPVDACGPILAPVVRALVDAFQAPDAVCAQSTLAANALATQHMANVSIDGRQFPTSLFSVTIAVSGERKSAVDSEILRAHRAFEEEKLEEYKADKGKQKIDLEIYEYAKKKILNQKLDSAVKRRQIFDLGPEPRPPANPSLLIEEPTYEGLIKLLALGGASVGLFSDEGGRMIGGAAMSQENQLKTAAGLSNLWDGKPISRSRAEDGTSKLFHKRLSLHLMLQPLVADGLTGNAILREQGLLSRCLIVYPKSTIGVRLYKSVNPRESEPILKFHHLIDRLLRSTRKSPADEMVTLGLPTLSLSRKAKEIFVAFHDMVEPLLAEGQPFQSIRGFGAKAAEQAARIAGGLTLLKDHEACNIGEDEMQMGATLSNFYLEEFLRVSQTGGLNPDLVLAEALKRWCQRNRKLIYPVLIYQFGPNAVREKAVAKRLIKILEDHGWLKPAPAQILDGESRTEVWEVIK